MGNYYYVIQCINQLQRVKRITKKRKSHVQRILLFEMIIWGVENPYMQIIAD